jgi:CubicO group peptidase (beta-lactamase class C family)
MGDLLKAWMPHRIYPAGTTPAYSNYATALAGYIVERVRPDAVRRLCREEYLHAARHAQRQLPPAAATGAGAAHVARLSGKPGEPAEPFEIIGPAPAGSLSASGVDMGRFMLANLRMASWTASASCRPPPPPPCWTARWTRSIRARWSGR